MCEYIKKISPLGNQGDSAQCSRSRVSDNRLKIGVAHSSSMLILCFPSNKGNKEEQIILLEDSE
jgi:hypothetical protein